MFYTDVNRFKNKILLRGYDEKGKRVKEEVDYKPYLFIPSKKPNTKYQNIHGEPVERMDFESMYEAKDFIKRYKDVENFKIYGMDRFEYPFIADTYHGQINYDVNLIRVMYLDIEVDSTNGFPDIEEANREITAITYRVGKRRVVFGMKNFDKNKCTSITDPENITYYKFKDEKSLLESFINLWCSEDVDVVTGWNIEFFDIPYIVRRIRVVLGDKAALKLSPWGKLSEREIELRGKKNTVFYPIGIAILDYMQVYKKFTYSQRESYTLNFIAHYELKVAKINYSDYDNLQDLYNKNPQLFFEYNIVDTDLVYALEDKLRLIELIFAIAYDAKVNYTDALGSVLLWDVIIMNYLMDRRTVIDPNKRKQYRGFEGAYVKDPQIGMHDWVVSFDLTSLYPHLIMQYNISPETFEGKDPHWDEHYSIAGLIREPVNFKMQGFIEQYVDCAVAANGCYYGKTKYGFLPTLMDVQFKLREVYKNEMISKKKKLQAVKEELAKRTK